MEKSKRIRSHCLTFNNTRVVDCEYHVLFRWDWDSDIRKTYLFSWYTRNRKFVSFCYLMSSRQVDASRKIALYVSKVLQCIGH